MREQLGARPANPTQAKVLRLGDEYAANGRQGRMVLLLKMRIYADQRRGKDATRPPTNEREVFEQQDERQETAQLSR